MLYKNRIVEGYSSSQIGIIIYHWPTCFCLYQSAIQCLFFTKRFLCWFASSDN